MAASNVFKVKMEKTDQLFNNYSTSALWIQDGRSANETRTAELAIIILYPTSAIGVIVLLKNAPKISRIRPDFICKNKRFSACF